MADKLVRKSSTIFTCVNCNYSTSRDSQYKRHLHTLKHKETYKRLTHASTATSTQIEYKCNCGKSYNHRQSLHKHKQKCQNSTDPEENIQSTPDIATDHTGKKLFVLVKELMMQISAKDKQQYELIQQNKELQTTLKELIPHIGNTNNTTNNTNSHNTFNIQMFLDNECKNAISIQDFIQSIEINMSHLVAMSKDGYVDSISNVLIKAFNDLAVTDRPLHCTDLKRETVYVKNNETWNKSTADTSVIGKVITTIENKHLLGIKNYIEETPESQVIDTPEHEFYHSTYWNTLGCGEDNAKLNKKIFKKILPSVKLDQQSVQ